MRGIWPFSRCRRLARMVKDAFTHCKHAMHAWAPNVGHNENIITHFLNVIFVLLSGLYQSNSM